LNISTSPENRLKHSTLQRVVVIPFVLLVLALGGVIYWASQRSAETAAREFSQKVVLNMLDRVGQATDRNLLGARVAVRAVAPDPVFSPADGSVTPVAFNDDLAALEERIWLATGFFPTVNNYVYFGGADGRFVGVNRRADRIELRWREASDAGRHVYAVTGPGKARELIRTDNYDARTRPWYKEAAEKQKESWSAVYTDFTTLEPTFTLTKPVYRNDGALLGVVATDLSLSQLTDFFSTLKISENGIAFVVERSGAVIATSTDELPYRVEGKDLRRMMVDQSKSPLLREAYRNVMRWQAEGRSLDTPQSGEFDMQGEKVQVAATLLRDPGGLEWLSVVAVPRADFIGNLTGVLYRSLAIGLVAVFLVLVFGFSLLQWVLRDIQKLTMAARSIGSGESMQPLNINIQRRDEIGELAKSFQEMERNLRTDKLTGVLNRDSLLTQIEFCIRNGTPAVPLKFVLLFIDLDRFKQINDALGHEAGDRVLIETASRLKAAVRANDEVARFGGDEFVVYLHGIDGEKDIEAVAEKLRQVIEQPVTLGLGTVGQVGASIGVAAYPADGRDVETIVRVADARMFGLKKARR
jgi:diguanylate cyclase (GGDEF)-like protein